MPGTVLGGKAAAKTNRQRYGEDFYRNIGQKGGQNGNTGGFYANPSLAREAGAKGGRASSRGIPRLLCVNGKTFRFDTVKEATEFAKERFGVAGCKFLDGEKLLKLHNGETAVIIKDPSKIY